ncbi:MAG: DUF563 domain-containing protein [Alphaproteobacteria bacterium]
MSVAVRDIALDRYRADVSPLPVRETTAADAVIRTVAFDRVLLSTPLFFPVTLDLHAFRDAFQVDGLYLAEAYDAVFDPAFAAGLAPRREALAAAPPGDAVAFVLGGSSNHFHWLLDFLPRLASVRPEAPPALLLVDAAFGPRQAEALEIARTALGLPPMPVRPLPDGVVGVRRAEIASAPSRAFAVAFWRRIGGPSAPRRRLFVRRGAVGRRRLLNEDRIAALLAPAGFESVAPGALAFADQMALFRDAAVVVGTHGAALANIVFMAEGGTVAEIVAAGTPTPFPALSQAAGLRHGVLAADVMGDTPEARLNADLTLPEAAIEALLERL